MAGKGNTVNKIKEIIQPIADEMGLKIWDVRFMKEGVSWYLRIFIDKDGGISVDDCANFSRAIDKPIDEADPIDGSYFMEVCSPGLERELTRPEHFEVSIGKDVFLRTIRPIDGVRDFSGKLTAYNDGLITVELKEGETKEFTVKETAFVKWDDFDMADFK